MAMVLRLVLVFLALFISNISAADTSCADTEAVFEFCDPNSINYIDCLCNNATPSEVAQCIIDDGNPGVLPVNNYEVLFAVCDVYANVSPAAASSLGNEPVSVVLATYTSIVNALATASASTSASGFSSTIASSNLTTSSKPSLTTSAPTSIMSVTFSQSSISFPSVSAASTPTSIQVTSGASGSVSFVGLQLHVPLVLMAVVMGLML